MNEMSRFEIEQAFLNGSTILGSGPIPDSKLMVEIAIAESKGNPWAHGHNKNGTIDRGLWQINSVHEHEVPTSQLIKKLGAADFREACYHPVHNAAFATLIWRAQGYKAWSTFDSLP